MKKHLPYDCSDDRELFDDSFHAASMSECTGLIPTAPVSQSEVYSYSQIYDIPLPNYRNDRRVTMNNNQRNNMNNNQKNNQKNNQNTNQNTNQKNNQNTNDRNQNSNQKNKEYND